MSIQRPTCHESWFRVRDLRVALRPGVQVRKQHFRGRPWRVIQDPSSQDYFRLSEPGYRFIGLLDGRRSVHEAWAIVSDQLGDEAPTQGEAIRLLGQLWSSNLIVGDVTPDVQAMLRRSRVRKEREIKGRLASMLSLRIPIFDPDRLLTGLAGPFSWLFTTFGLVLWMLVVGSGLWQMAGRWGAISEAARGALAPTNLPWLYASFVVVKLLHELGHGLSCKVFGRREGTGGEVHAVGIMLLVLLPVPYIDATSAWGLRSKWRRIVVGSSGMMAELVVAALAAWIWTRAADGSTLSAIAANTILIAGVSTLLFNGNPLLRYDGYFILSDMLEMPNLQQRGRDLLYGLIKLHAWGVRGARGAIETTASTMSERTVLLVYGVAATTYRIFITVAIVFFVAGQLFFVGVALAIMAVLAWFVLPLVKLAHYLVTSPELERVRWRACTSTIATVVLLGFALGLAPAAHRVRAVGVVEAPRSIVVRMGESGFVEVVLPAWSSVNANAQLIRARSDALVSHQTQWRARMARFDAEYRKARAEDPARAAIILDQRRAAREELDQVGLRLDRLTLRADRAGIWHPQRRTLAPGAFVARGEPLGLLVDSSDLVVRFQLDQDAAALLIGREGDPVALRPVSGGDAEIKGSIERVVEAGSEAEQEDDALPSSRTFEMVVTIGTDADWRPRPGLPLVGMIALEPEPLGIQALRKLRRVLQHRFGL